MNSEARVVDPCYIKPYILISSIFVWCPSSQQSYVLFHIQLTHTHTRTASRTIYIYGSCLVLKEILNQLESGVCERRARQVGDVRAGVSACGFSVVGGCRSAVVSAVAV